LLDLFYPRPSREKVKFTRLPNPQEQALTAELITRVAYNYHWEKAKGSFSGGAADAGGIFLSDRVAEKRSLFCVCPMAGWEKRAALVGLCAGIKLLLCLDVRQAPAGVCKLCKAMHGAAMQISHGRILFATSACCEVTLYMYCSASLVEICMRVSTRSE
jgi:hypothetical protein